MFVFANIEKIINIVTNYPKYVIIQNSNRIDEGSNNIFYYLIIPKINFYYATINFPIYMITNYLYFNLRDSSEKFNLSKLGTDYLVNAIGDHFKDECIGRYPENYVFVNEPDWPIYLQHIKNRTFLKYTKYGLYLL